MKPEKIEPLVMSVPEAAKLIGVSTRTAYTLAHQKGFPAFYISPNRLVVGRAALEAWVAAKTKTGESF